MRRRAPSALVGADDGGDPIAVQIPFEPLQIQSQLRRIAHQILALRGALIGEEEIVHLPELALLGGRKRCLMRQLRLGMHGKRKMSERDRRLDAVGRRGLQLTERPGEARTERTLEIGEEHDLHAVRGLDDSRAGEREPARPVERRRAAPR